MRKEQPMMRDFNEQDKSKKKMRIQLPEKSLLPPAGRSAMCLAPG
jgi:hypothetical protein